MELLIQLFSAVPESVWQALIAGVVTVWLAKIQKDTQRTVEAVHTLVNSGHGVTLQIASTALARVADLTSDPLDRQEANKARSLLDVHNRQQAIVDARS